MLAPSSRPRWLLRAARLILHSVIRPMTGCGWRGLNSVLCASFRPSTWRPNSIDGQLHPQTDSQVRDALLARVAHRLILPSMPRSPKAARHQDASIRQGPHAIALDIGGFHVVHAHAGAGLEAACIKARSTICTIADLHVLADMAMSAWPSVLRAH